MPILRYIPEEKMAIADDPMFPAMENLAAEYCIIKETLVLQDWKPYFVKFYGDSVPDFFKNAYQYCFYQEFPGQLFEIGFKNVAGLTRIGPVPVRVQSKKIPEELYTEMLNYIADQYANLAFSFNMLTGQQYGKVKAGKDIAYIEYLFLKKYLLDSSPHLDSIAAQILADPHRRLQSENRHCHISEVTSLSPTFLMSMLASPEWMTVLQPGHQLLSSGLGKALLRKDIRRYYPAKGIEEHKYHSIDTNENRFVRYLLETIQRLLSKLKNALANKTGGYLNPGIEEGIMEMDRKIRRFLADPLWNDVGTMLFPPLQSQFLQKRDGYRQLFQLYCLLQLASRCFFEEDDFKNLLETKDTPTLFEYWSFFIIKEVLDDLLVMSSCNSIVSDDPIEQKVRQGVRIDYKGGFSLLFNRSFRGSANGYFDESYSHTLRPDIVLSNGKSLLIFDAKFKGKGSGFYGEDDSGTITVWRDEDIDKMHCYRDAIKGVGGAFILYPGEKSVVYKYHNTEKLCDGVGALPLKPQSGSRPVQDHLEKIKDIINDFIKES